MENNDRRPRQNIPGYSNQQGTQFPQGQYPVGSSSDRFRQHGTLTSTAHPAASTPARSQAGAQGYGFSYEQGSQFPGAPIQSSYAAQDYTQDQQPQRGQQYAQYGQVAYNLPRGAPSAAGPSQYGTVPPQYQQGQDSAIEVMNGGFGSVAQSQYYGAGGQEGETGAPATAMGTQNIPPQYSNLPYTPQQAPVGRESLPPTYNIAAAMSGPRQPTPQGSYSQGNFSDQGDETTSHLMRYIQRTNEFTRDGLLHEAEPRLLECLKILIEHLEHLGLTRDEDDAAKSKRKLDTWNEFNNCFLAALQKQKMMLEKGQRPQPPQSLIDHERLLIMGQSITDAADQLEKHGLVDYQRGIWEEEIISMITDCLDLYNDFNTASSSQQPNVAQPSRRR